MHAYDFGLLFIRLPKNPSPKNNNVNKKERHINAHIFEYRHHMRYICTLYCCIKMHQAESSFLRLFLIVVSFTLSLAFFPLSGVPNTWPENFSPFQPFGSVRVCMYETDVDYTYTHMHVAYMFISNVLLFIPVRQWHFHYLAIQDSISKNRRKWLTTNSTTSTHTHGVVFSWIGNVGVGSPVCIRHSFYLNNFLSNSLGTTYPSISSTMSHKTAEIRM